MNKLLVAILVLFLSVLVFGGYFYASAQTVASWHMINVNQEKNQGDANLIINGDVVTMIDAGYRVEAKKAVVPYLQNLKIKTIDHFFISHPHRDHYQGMEAIQNSGIIIKNVYYSMPPSDVVDCCYSRSHFIKYLDAAKNRGAILHDIAQGFNLSYPNGSSIKVLYAHKTSKQSNKNVDINDMSLIMKWSIEKFDVLFTGDLNKNIGSYLANDSRMKSDFLKMPHHGGRSIAPNSFFDAVNPNFVLVPGPKWIWCGERGDQARSWTQSKKTNYWVNGLNGNIRIDFNKTGGEIYRETDDECSGITNKEFTSESPLSNPYIFQ